MAKKLHECSYPDCGCPEARLCMAGNPNFGAVSLNTQPSDYSSKERAKKKINPSHK